MFFGRLLPVIRTFISLPAGVARMDFRKFTLFTLLGCLPWCIALTWLGYVLGDHWATVENVLRPIAWLIAILLLAAIAWWVRGRVKVLRTERPQVDPTQAEATEESEPVEP